MNTSIQTKATPSNLVITPLAAETAGAVSYWRCGGPISLETLQDAWEDAGLDVSLLREAPDDRTALRRAVQAQQDRHRLVRALKRGAWAIVDEHVVAVAEGQPVEPPTYTTVAIVRFDEGVGPVTESVDGNGQEADAIQDAVYAEYRRQQGMLDPGDVTSWLVKLAYKHGAVTLRDSGGVYFIPRPAMDFWNKAAGAVEKASRGSHLVFRIPAMKNDEAVAAITDAITQEAAQVVEAMQEDLLKVGEEQLGKRALTTRQGEAEKLLAKLNSYEELLGKQLSVREQVMGLQANLTAAVLIASAEQEA